MEILQIQQLKYSSTNITISEQKKLCGGGDSRTLVSSGEEQEQLWSGYANGTYDIFHHTSYGDNDGDYLQFITPSQQESDDKTSFWIHVK